MYSFNKKKFFFKLSSEQIINFLNIEPDFFIYKFLNSKNRKLVFIMKGGNKDINNTYDKKTGEYNFEINDNKYYYKVERYSPENDNKFRFIDLITIKDKYKNNIDCGSIQINKKGNSASIISLGNSNKCLKSEKDNVEFKYGDVIFQILIDICKKENLNKIELTDNSNKKCGNYSLILNYLKTLTHGVPHYYKYGFKFKYEDDNKILKKNYKNYLTDPKITKEELLNLLKDKGKIDMINHLTKVINKIETNEISIKKFVLLLTRDLKNNDYCELVYNIYVDLYIKAGYLPYYTKDYVLSI